MKSATTTRGSFLAGAGLFITGTSLASLTACSSSGSRVLPSGSSSTLQPYNYTRHLRYSAHGTTSSTRKSSAFQICTSDGCSGDGGGDIYSDPTAYHVRAVATDGSEVQADVDESAAAQLTFSSGYPGSVFNTTASQQMPEPTAGVQQTTTYANGASLVRTIVDDNNASGVFVDPQGNSWNVSIYVNATQLTLNYSGPQSGTITLTASDITYSSGARSVLGCSEKTRAGIHSVGLAFDAAGLVLAGLGIGVPFGLISAGIGLAIGLYGQYC